MQVERQGGETQARRIKWTNENKKRAGFLGRHWECSTAYKAKQEPVVIGIYRHKQ